MKIELGLEDNTWKVLDEVYWILKNRKVFKKNKKCEISTYTKYMFEINMIYLFIMLLGVLFFVLADSKSFVFFTLLCVILGILLLWDIYTLYCIYRKTKNSDGYIELSEDGILDFSNGISLSFSWEKVDYVVVGKESLVITFDATSLCFYLNVKYADDFIKEIRKYVKHLRVFK